MRLDLFLKIFFKRNVSMKKLLLFVLISSLMISFSVSTTSCRRNIDKPKDTTIVTKVPVVSQFVYDGMSNYYLWAAEMAGKKPATSSTDPQAYFQTLLNAKDKEMGWSWITDDVDALLADFSGTPVDFGWNLSLLWADQARTKIVAFVKFVYPNTPAANAGIVRGNVITKINGNDIVSSTTASGYYQKLYGADQITVTVEDQNYQNPTTKIVSPAQIQTNPVLKDSIYEINGKKIGYLFYASFIGEFNDRLYQTFTKFKTAGINDLVLDLRYNHGGAISAASFLASLIAPQGPVQSKSDFTILSYNDAINQLFDQRGWTRKDVLGVSSKGLDPLGANLNLPRVYIIATNDSYSAAELITFCLKPYMNVIHIGSNTGGKFTGSWTIHAYDSHNDKAVTVYDATKMSNEDKFALKKWGMQPIVAKYTDKNGADFVSPGHLVPNEVVTSQENDTRNWKQLGDRNDYLLAKAISLITGIPVSGAAAATLPRNVYGFRESNLFDPVDARLKESVQLIPPKELRQKGSELIMMLKQGNFK